MHHLFEVQKEFASANLHNRDEKVLFNCCKYAQLKTHSVPQIIHQNQCDKSCPLEAAAVFTLSLMFFKIPSKRH